MAMTEPHVDTRSDRAPEGSTHPVETAVVAADVTATDVAAKDVAATTQVNTTPAWPTHDLARRTTAGSATAGPMIDAWTDAPADASTDVSADPSTAIGPTSTSHRRDDASAPAGTGAMATLTDSGARRPTKFLADLTRAMRVAADESRHATLEQFKADAAACMEEIRSESKVFAAQCREQAEADVESLNEWSRTEMERIRRETDEGIAARRQRLEDDLAAQDVRLVEAVESVEGTVTSFQDDMERFFERLMHEEEPSTFAAMAGQLPEPPPFAPWSPEGTPAPEPTSGDGQTGAATEEAPMATVATDGEAGPESKASAGRATIDAPAPTAAGPKAPGAAAPTAADSSRHRSTGSYPTEIVIVGLVSVASIATFKRLLGRTPGIRAVHVSSGPSGEFVFGINHDEGADVQKALMDLPVFVAQIVDVINHVISAVVTDPEQA